MKTKIQRTPNYKFGKTIAQWKLATYAAENILNPKYHLLFDIYTDILLDSHLHAVIQNRKANVLSSDFELINPDGERLQNPKWLLNVIEWLAETPFFGFTVLEFYQNEFYLLPRKHYSPFTNEIVLDLSNDKRITIKNPLMAFKDYSAELGLLHKACPMIFYKRYALSAWSEYIEKFSMPLRIGKTNREDIQAREQLFRELENIGRAAFGVIDMEDEIEFIETSKSDAFQTFDAIIERCNSEISKLILGQTATTDEKSFVGAANVHERQANSITWQDKHQIQLWLNEFILPLANINATFQWITSDDLSIEKQWNIHRDMIQLGLPVDLDFISQKYNTPFINNQQNNIQIPIQNNNEKKPLNFETPYIEYRLNPFQKVFNWFKNTFFFNLKDKDLLKIHQNQKPSQELFDYFSNELINALNKGFANPEKNPELYLKLKHNLLEFAAAKHYAFLQTDKPLLHKNYLITEKNTALAQAQMAYQFIDWTKKGLNLKYQTAKDDKVRKNHQILDGIVKPANDPFWIGKTPPLGWNCRCNLIPTNANPTDKNINVSYDDNYHGIHPFFQQKIFSDNHNYFQYLPQNVKDNLNSSHYDPLLNKKDNFYLYAYNIQTQSTLKIHPKAHNKDLKDNINAALQLINPDKIEYYKINKKGLEKSEIINTFTILIREHIEKENVSNPEFIINELIGDLYTPDKIQSNTIKNTMDKKGSYQKINCLVIKTKNISKNELKELELGIKEGFKIRRRIKVVYLLIEKILKIYENTNSK